MKLNQCGRGHEQPPLVMPVAVIPLDVLLLVMPVERINNEKKSQLECMEVVEQKYNGR